jgi:hypothetical protein
MLLLLLLLLLLILILKMPPFSFLARSSLRIVWATRRRHWHALVATFATCHHLQHQHQHRQQQQQ